jgi:hypothetical protein
MPSVKASNAFSIGTFTVTDLRIASTCACVLI